ncbi:hypothetical protein EIP86_001206 [Pleurotus ostreatoroseus]|nr:hypothetical protein EIP86_001206 [Pleurotus ostreatoroseus]
MSPSTQRELITLVVPRTSHVIGEVFEGEVLLDFAKLQHAQILEIHVKLRGSLHTSVRGSNGQNSSSTTQQTIELTRQDVSLWTRGSAYPQPGVDVLRLPFQLPLRAIMELPSCFYKGRNWTGCVGYSIEVVGVRNAFRSNKRVSLPLSVIPPNARGAELSQGLRSGWLSAREFPMFIPIPFELEFITTTKPMRKEETPEDRPIFPAPPDHPKNIEFNLSRWVMVRAHRRSAYTNVKVADLGGFGSGVTSSEQHWHDQVDVEKAENFWTPDIRDESKQLGSWNQQPALSLVDSLNSTYKLNGMQPQHRSQDSSPVRPRRTSTDSKSPPVKRRKLSTTPSTSLSSLLPTPTSSLASIPSTVSSYTTRTSTSPAVATQNIVNDGGRQETAPKRKAPPLPRLPRKPQSTTGVAPLSIAGPSRASDYASPVGTVSTPGQSNPSMRTPADTPTLAHKPISGISREKPSSAASQRQSDSPSQMLPPPRAHILTPSPSPVATPHSSVRVKVEPIATALPPPSSAFQAPVHDLPQHASVKSEPVTASVPPSPSRPSHPPEHATSGTERVHPIPENCRPGAPDWNANRQQWMHAAVRNVKRKGLKVTRVKLLSDGLVIDCEQTTAAPPAPLAQPSNPPASSQPVPPSPVRSGSTTSAHAPNPSPPTPTTPAPVPSESTPVASISIPAPPPDVPSSLPVLPPSADAPKAAKMSMFAKMLARQKKIQAEKQAVARQQMEQEALKRQEEAAHRMPSPLPATPPPPDYPSPFRLDTPPPPWETDIVKPPPQNKPISPAQIPSAQTTTLATATPPANPNPIFSSPSGGLMSSPASKPPQTASSSSRGSSIDAVAKMVQAPEFSDDDDMYMDPNDPPPHSQLTESQDVQGNGWKSQKNAKTEAVDSGSPSKIASTDEHPAEPAAKAKPSRPVSPASPAASTSTFQPPTSLVISATQEGLQNPNEAEREQLENDAVEWLKHDSVERTPALGRVQTETESSAGGGGGVWGARMGWGLPARARYIITFDSDRSALAASYSQHATFSLRQLAHPASSTATVIATITDAAVATAPDAPALPKPGDVLTGPLAILAALLALPASFSFHVGAARPPRVLFDLVVTFDMVVYGSSADAGGPGILVVCYIDPTGPHAGGLGGGDAEAGQGGREEEEEDRKRSVSVDGGASLVALSHQMTLRRIPAGMAWNWQ